SAHELAAALEDIGRFVGEFAAPFEQLFAAVEHFLAGIRQDFPALFGLLGDKAARVPPALRSVQERNGGAHCRAYQKPSNADSTIFTGHVLLLKMIPRQLYRVMLE